ncbi:phosphatase PAP2 family protein [Deinococcus koreensis]|uniref:Phosphatidylglycerophosphatase n=1 Tax=Deinococcus koreensis TaxID=2054903 RepID=A0A2K3UTW8_9DEIO|nr:phosphatase PAP2 family protein [Deinococcus koreensis]PNY79976.1 phosphatidylglycerophosphatase [Deinococcus koreensis]
MWRALRTAALPLLRLHWRLILLVLLGVLAPLVLIAELTEEVFRDGGFSWDQAILEWYAAHRTPGLTLLARVLAVLGGVPALPIITLGIALVLARFRTRAHAWFLILAVSGATVLNGLAKVAFQRARPGELVAVLNEPGFSFPSGHAMSNMAFGMALCLVFWHSRARWPAALLGVGWGLLVGISRNYLGVHYPTDVLVGCLSSVTWVVGLYLVVRKRWRVLNQPAPP